MAKLTTIKVSLNANDLFGFSFYHNYTRLSGILTGVMGLAGLVLTPVMLVYNDKFSALLLAFLAVAFLIQPLISYFTRAKRQFKTNPIFKNEMIYEIKKEGIDITQLTLSHQLEWKDILKIVENTKYFFIYVNEVQAFILPKRFFENVEQIDEFRERLMKLRDKVQLKVKDI